MQITIPQFPHMPETLSYTALGAAGLNVLIAILIAVTGDKDLVASLFVLGIAASIYWFICRQLATVVSAKQAAIAGAILLALCALADFLTAHPYHGLLFLIAAASLTVVFFLLMEGTMPIELRLGGIVAVGSSARAAHLEMLAELHRAGILSADEVAAKSQLVTV
ncbi:MAG TPA: hypothetical protein VFA12_15995 [Stellaceae bacterium]|nr:hypothetical protein [Stellaceae bacterium]